MWTLVEESYDDSTIDPLLLGDMAENMRQPFQNDDAQLLGLVQAVAQEVEGDNSRKRSRNVYEEVTTTTAPELTETQVNHNFPRAQPNRNSPLPMIFRPPSEKSKRYSRPALSAVFTSLELDPLVFTRLEGQAKRYMLDPAHPERRDVIGSQRVQGSDAARIKVRNVTREFLESGAGEEYWGKDAGINDKYTPERTMVWPGDAADIIKLLMPLMRKMVSNERQRIYAEIARKAKTGGKKASDKASQSPVNHNEIVEIVDDEPATPSVNNSGPIDDPPLRPAPNVTILVNILSRDEGGRTKRLLPRFKISAAGLGEFVNLRRTIKMELMKLQFDHPQASEVDVDFGQYKAWLESGLADINSDGDWLLALVSCEATEWMDAELRLLVFV